jgi:predicted enzyme related to lactoylglutathione lyase
LLAGKVKPSSKLANFDATFLSVASFVGASPEVSPTLTVESIEEYINKAKQLGARVVKDKQEISEGYYAVLEDPQKNTFGIWQEK